VLAASSRFVHACRRHHEHDLSFDGGQSDGTFISQSQFDSIGYSDHTRSSLVPLVAERVSLPSGVGSVDLSSVLPPELSSAYTDPTKVLAAAPDASVLAKLRGASVAGSQSEYESLIRRMLSLGMVTPILRPKVVNGVFCVPKDKGALRLIIDARAANAHFVKAPAVQLPTPDLLATLVPDASRPLFVAKSDVDNFYHRLRLPLWMRAYFALPPVSAGAVGLEGARIDGADAGCVRRLSAADLVFPACVTLPMGWSHSVYVAQRAHEHIIATRTGLRSADAVTPHNGLLIDRTRHHVYIDDVTWIGHDEKDVARSQQEYNTAMEVVGLPTKASKNVPPSCGSVESVGMEFDGTRHTVGVRPAKLLHLQMETERLIESGQVTGVELSSLLGKWTWACLAARPALSVFQSVYRFVKFAGSRSFQLWRSVIRELRVISGLAPLLFTHLSAPVFRRVLATDASSVGLGVCARHLTEEDVRAVSAPPQMVAADDEGTADVDEPQHVDWRVLVAARWRRSEHINVLEMRALLTALRWVWSSPWAMGSRIVIYSDSRVLIGSALKGRSSSPPLLRRLRAVAAMCLAAGLRLRLRWIASAFNPADGPSRIYC
jgi:hypothetical protein